jgi:FkbM family methyltransferase
LPAPKIVIKSKILTSIFQKYLNNKDIRIFKKNFFYFVIFRIIRNFLAKDLIIKIYNFKVFGSFKRNKTSYYLLKKCEFGDYHELSVIRKISKKSKTLLIDCGCNYGFYSFYTASLARENLVISIEASEKTSKEFLKNLKLNNFSNINFYNRAISNIDDKKISFNESENDWESSQTHNNFKIESIINVKTLKIDTLMKNYDFNKYQTIIKLDVEGNEIKVIQGGLEFIKNTSPLIIIEFSRYIFENLNNIDYLMKFLNNYDYSIYDTSKNKKNLGDILTKLNLLKKKFKTIGNYYLIKNSSKSLQNFISDE